MYTKAAAFTHQRSGPKQNGQPLSMTSLIHWNIKRALNIYPNLDLKEALRSTWEKLVSGSSEPSSTEPEGAHERHLTCAVLAWRALGHNDMTALYRLVSAARCKEDAGDIPARTRLNNQGTNKSDSSKHSKCPDDSCYSEVESFRSHPLHKPPIGTKLVMHVTELNKHQEHQEKPSKQTKHKMKKDVEKKIEAACCLDSSCATRLTQFDSAVEALRARSSQLARRDAQRAELLERAEAAWRDLELGYQRRLQVLQEKEDDLSRQIKDLVEERNGYKKACTSIAEFLNDRGTVVEQECQRLNATEKELCDCTRQRHLLAEDATRFDNVLGEQHCLSVQQDRDLQFKEEQLRRKVASLKSTVELQRALSLEAERAARAELASLRDQRRSTADEVRHMETENAKLQQHCSELKTLNESLTRDLEALKDSCDPSMQKKVEELKSKSKQLAELKQQLTGRRCTAPTDAAAHARRTASLAAVCRCERAGDDGDTCSCTSVRTKLLTEVLEGLFSGLHEETAACASALPCMLLKCLDDNHDWDRASVIKTRLTDHFSKLLSGELDIVIENYIERHRTKWVDAISKSGPKHKGEQHDTVLYSVHEVTAQFWPHMLPYNVEKPEEKYVIEHLTPKNLKTSISTATFAVQHPSRAVVDGAPACTPAPRPDTPDRVAAVAGASAQWRRTHQNVTQLRVEIEDLKKEAIKKDDLKMMQNQLTKIMRKASNIVRLTSNNAQHDPVERKTFNTIPKPIVKSKDISSLQVENKHISPDKILPRSTDKKEFIAKNVRKPNEIGLPPKRVTNKMDKIPKVRNNQASKAYGKCNYPQRFLFGKETKSTWMDMTMTNQVEQHTVQASVLDEVLGKENEVSESHNYSVDDYASDQSSKIPREFDTLLEQLTKWTNIQSNSEVISDDRQQNMTKNIEEYISSIPIREKEGSYRMDRNIVEKKNENASEFITHVKKSQEENMLQTSEMKSLGAISFTTQNVQSLTPEKIVINVSQAMKTSNNLYNVPPTDEVQTDFHMHTKTVVPNSRKTECDYSESKKSADLFIESDTGKLQKTDSVTNLVSNLRKELVSSKATSQTYKILDNMRKILLGATTEKQSNPKQKISQTEVKSHITERNCESNLDNKSLKTTFMKKIDLNESQSCVCCCYENSNEAQKPYIFQKNYFSNSRCDNNDEMKKPISCSFNKIEPTILNSNLKNFRENDEKKNIQIDWEKVHSLMSKYITAKIKRVQRMPDTKTNRNSIKNGCSSNLLSKICYVIENDLKEIRKMPMSNNELFDIQKESVEKDGGNGFLVSNTKVKSLLNLCTEIRTLDVFPTSNKKSEAINENIITLTTSCQVSGEIQMNNKSCLAVEKKFSQLKVIYHKNHLPDCKKEYVSCACSPAVSHQQCSCNLLKGLLFDKLGNETPTIINNSLSYGKQRNENGTLKKSVNVTKSDQITYKNCSSIYEGERFIKATGTNKRIKKLTNVDMDSQRNTKLNYSSKKECDINNVSSPCALPCFGYTIECTCDKNLGPCVCTKGLLSNKRDEVDKLWNMAVTNKQKNLDIFNVYVLGERLVTESPQAITLNTCETISNKSKSDSRGSDACVALTSMNNLYVASSDITVKNSIEEAIASRSKCLTLKSDIHVGLSESVCSKRTLSPNVNLGGYSTNSFFVGRQK